MEVNYWNTKKVAPVKENKSGNCLILKHFFLYNFLGKYTSNKQIYPACIVK